MDMKILKCGIVFLGVMLIIMPGCNSGSVNSESGEHAKTDTVLISQMKFVPESITVNKGDTVLFINQDIVPHNAVQTDSTWYSPTLNNGDSWRFVPEKSDDYYCSIHLVMKGKIIVK